MPPKRKPTKATQRKATTQRAGESLWRDGFIAALSRHGNVTAACDNVGINRTTAYRAREDDKAFADLWDNALNEASDRIEFEALRRAKRGTLKPVYYQGKRVGYEREYSDTLMGMMLKGHKPEKYGDKLTIKISPADLELLRQFNMTPAEAFEKLIQNLHKVANE